MEKNIYYKQSKLYNPNNDEQPIIHVYGAGSIGSHVVIGLLKTGFENITVYDYDILEEDNLPAQMYPRYILETELTMENDGLIDKKKHYKVDYLKNFAEVMTCKKINIERIKIDERFNPDISQGSIHILCFDNIETRKTMKVLLSDFPVYLIDGRIGGWYNEIYYTKMDDLESRKYYKESLEQSFSELECGEKTLWCNNSYIASKIIMNVIKISKGEQETIPMLEKTNMKGQIIITKKKGETI